MEQLLSQQIQAMRRRVQGLYRSAHSDTHERELLPKAFDELDYALEELQTLETELHEQQVQFMDSQERLVAERQTYQELFEFAPVSYLITSPEGTIHRANQAAAALFGTIEKFMIGRSLALFVPEGERRAFRATITRLAGEEGIWEWEGQMQPWGGPAFDAAISLGIVRGQLGHPRTLRWIIKKLGQANELAGQHDRKIAQPAPLGETGRARVASQ